MFGSIIAFQDFSVARGFLGSKFVGLKHFIKLFNYPDFYKILRNSLILSGLKIVFTFPIPVILALMLDEVRIKSIKRKEYLTGTLFFEVDYWTMTRDPGMVTFEDFEVTKLVMDEKEKSASVSFVVCEYNDDVPARVDLVYEDGRWVIDNFYDLRYMLNLRHCMWNYLNNDFI